MILNQQAASSDFINKTLKTDNASDLGLIHQIVLKDENALEKLYQRYQIPLYNYLIRIVNDHFAAEDVLQEVFVAVWEGAGRFQARASVKTWVFRIAHFKAVSWIRSNYKFQQTNAIDDLEQLESEQELPEPQALHAWEVAHIHQAMDQLSSIHREVVELFFANGFSYQEIAEIADCPVGTVKSRMNKAIRVLSGFLKFTGIDEQ